VEKPAEVVIPQPPSSSLTSRQAASETGVKK